MSVYIQCGRCLAVTEAVRYCFDVCPVGQQQGGRGMSELVQADIRQLILKFMCVIVQLEDFLEFMRRR